MVRSLRDLVGVSTLKIERIESAHSSFVKRRRDILPALLLVIDSRHLGFAVMWLPLRIPLVRGGNKICECQEQKDKCFEDMRQRQRNVSR